MYDNQAQVNYFFDNLALEIAAADNRQNMVFSVTEAMGRDDLKKIDVPGDVLTIR